MNLRSAIFIIFLLLLFSKKSSATEKREIRLQNGLNNSIESLSHSRDGSILFTSLKDNSLLVWDVASGLQIRSIHHPEFKFDQFCLSDDKDELVTWRQGEIGVWDWMADTLIRLIKLPKDWDPVQCNVLHGRNKLLVLLPRKYDGGAKLSILNFKTGEVEKEYTFSEDLELLQMTVGSSQKKLAVVSKTKRGNDYFVDQIDLKRKKKSKLVTTKFKIRQVLYSPDETELSVVQTKSYWVKDESPAIEFWDTKKRVQLSSRKITAEDFYQASYSPDGKFLVVGGRFKLADSKPGSHIKMYETTSNTEVFQKHMGKPYIPVFNPDGRVFTMFSSFQRQIVECNPMDGSVFRDLSNKFREVGKIRLSNNGNNLAAISKSSANKDFTIKIWNTKTGRVDHWLRGHTYNVYDVLFSPSDHRLYSLGGDGLRIWETQSWTQIHHQPEIGGNCLIQISDSTILIGRDFGNVVKYNIKSKSYTSIVGKLNLDNSNVNDGAITAIDHRNGYTVYRQHERVVVLKDEKKLREIIVGNFGASVWLTDDLIIYADHKNGLTRHDIKTGTTVKWNDPQKDQHVFELGYTSQLGITGSNQPFAKTGNISLWDLTRGRKLWTLINHEQGILDLESSPDGKLYSASEDGTIGVWDLKMRKLLMSWVANESEYISFTEKGFYTSSRNGYKLISIQKGSEIYGFEQFDLQLNRPDLIVKVLSPQSRELIRSYHDAINRRKSFDNSGTPDFRTIDISIDQKSKIPVYTDLKQVEIKLISTTLSKNSTLLVWNNGVRQNAEISSKVVKSEIEYNVRTPLQFGQNLLSFQIETDHNHRSKKQQLFINRTSKAEHRTLYILCMSVSDYQDDTKDLRYAVKDGRDFLRTILEKYHSEFDEVIVDTLFNKDALKTKFKSMKHHLNLGIDDRMILYFSGHGILSESNSFYFGTHDIDFSKPESSGISLEEIESMLTSSPCQEKLLLLDACHGGIVDESEKSNNVISDTAQNTTGAKGALSKSMKAHPLSTSFSTMELLFNNLNEGSGAHTITASAGNSYAYESDEWHNGVFTYTLINGLRNGFADLNQDGQITISELKQFLAVEVIRLTDGKQKPTFREENLEFDWSF